MLKSTTDRMNDYDAVVMGVLEPVLECSGPKRSWVSDGAPCSFYRVRTANECPLRVIRRLQRQSSWSAEHAQLWTLETA
jgi:hypothetical protein